MNALEKFLIRQLQKRYPGHENYTIHWNKGIICIGGDWEKADDLLKDNRIIGIDAFINSLKTAL